ncbi:hypothetical protein [Halomonas sp. H10-9-1]|uniref:hypothetical protein n=1 Tax=Halomonas sp. H10-9-1 TaxID=2950871 RepID=UPI0032DF16E2
MTYVLTLRRIDQADLSRAAPFMPEDEEVETCLQSIESELNSLASITEVKREGAVFCLGSSPEFNLEQVRKELKPILSGSVTEFVRFVSLERSIP